MGGEVITKGEGIIDCRWAVESRLEALTEDIRLRAAAIPTRL